MADFLSTIAVLTLAVIGGVVVLFALTMCIYQGVFSRAINRRTEARELAEDQSAMDEAERLLREAVVEMDRVAAGEEPSLDWFS